MLLVIVCYLLMIHCHSQTVIRSSTYRYLKFYFKYFFIITFTLRNDSGLVSRY